MVVVGQLSMGPGLTQAGLRPQIVDWVITGSLP